MKIFNRKYFQLKYELKIFFGKNFRPKNYFSKEPNSEPKMEPKVELNRKFGALLQIKAQFDRACAKSTQKIDLIDIRSIQFL